MHCNASGIWFHFILKNHLKLSKKIDFLAHFERFLVYTFLHPMSYTPIFCQIKRLMEIHNRGKFHWCNICGCWVINFQKCFCGNAASMKWPLLGGFWALSPINMTRVWLNFDQKYVFHKTKTVSEQSFKIKCLSGHKTYPKLIVLVHFWAQFTPKKPKTLPKPNFFPETTSLWLSTNTSPRSQINHKILIKLIK